MLVEFPPPRESDYKSSDEGEQTASPEAKTLSDVPSTSRTTSNIAKGGNIKAFADAVDAIRIREFGPAIEFLEEYLKKNQNIM